MPTPDSLCTRNPHLDRAQLIAGLTPPPQFADVRFETYEPDSSNPSQTAAVAALQAFAQTITAEAGKRRLFGRSRQPDGKPGVYLDGGFGVGKTHLLASLWHATAHAGPRAYGTFVELTNLVGALGFEQTVDALSTFKLLCIDEFELDDPGDTVLMSTLATRLVDSGVRLAATSNTLPDRLGDGRFAADDFVREIQGLSSKFEIIRIDGADYRHRGLAAAPRPWSEDEVINYASTGSQVTLDGFDDLMAHLATIHPSRYGALLADTKTVCWTGVSQLPDQSQALRFVVLVDRMYDRDIRLRSSGVPVDELFDEEMLAGGYRKKYRRAVSRLTAMAEAL